MPVSTFRKEEWELLEKELTRSKPKGKVTIFMSSSTDPYQPVEHKEKITRSLLELKVENQPDFLFIKTRSPLVRRDIDFKKQGAGKSND